MRKIHFAIFALGAGALTWPLSAQRAPRAPTMVGIDALRADFRAASGSDTVYFGDGSSGLGAPARAVLGAQARWLRAHPEVVVSVEGFADISDTRDHALAIAARRAVQVRDYLIIMGVPSAQVTATSWGKERVAVQGTSEPALAANRRVQTVLVR